MFCKVQQELYCYANSFNSLCVPYERGKNPLNTARISYIEFIQWFLTLSYNFFLRKIFGQTIEYIEQESKIQKYGKPLKSSM